VRARLFYGSCESRRVRPPAKRGRTLFHAEEKKDPKKTSNPSQKLGKKQGVVLTGGKRTKKKVTVIRVPSGVSDYVGTLSWGGVEIANRALNLKQEEKGGNAVKKKPKAKENGEQEPRPPRRCGKSPEPQRKGKERALLGMG